MIFDILYKTLISYITSRIRFDKINEFIKIYDGIRCLILFGSEKYDAICIRIRHLINLESTITFFFHYYAKDKVFSYNSLPIEKRFTLYNVIILIKSVK